MSKNIPIPSDLHALLYDAKHLSDKIEIALIETGGEITKELEELLAFKDYTVKALCDSVDVVVMTSERIEMTIDYYQKQVDAIKALQNGLLTVKGKLLLNIESEMNRLNLKEISGTDRCLAFRNNPPKVDILSENEIPYEFKKITIVENFDKKLISDTLKKGEEVPGCRLIQGRSLIIKKAKPQLKEKEDNNE